MSLRAKPGSPPRPLPGKAAVLEPAAKVYLAALDAGEYAAESAAFWHLGGGLRAAILMPLVVRRAEWKQRVAKRREQMIFPVPYALL